MNEVQAIESVKLELADHGFLLCDTQAITGLPDSAWLDPRTKPDYYASGSLLLVGHAGKRFWESLNNDTPEGYMQGPDPVDNYSAEVTEHVLEKYLPSTARQRLFPTDDCLINLMALGKAFEWHTASPLGMGIHEQYGLWSAYRAVWWLDLVIPKAILEKATDVCLKCQTQECVSACPAEAINVGINPDLGRCADYRLEEGSSCQSTCLSRMACPQATEHRYSAPQMQYHYDLARSAIAKYRQQSE